MDAAFLILQTLTGLAGATQLFLIASGLTIIFGVTRIVNFAHGSLYMLGAYIGVTLADRLMTELGDALGFWVAIPVTALAVGCLGVVLEVVLLRRLYRSHELFQLLATFGVVLIVQDLVLLIWGPQDILGPRAPGMAGGVDILGQRFPTYDLFLIGLSPLVLGGLWLLFNRTRWGTLVRAATQDREMTAALGVNQAVLFTGVVFLGAALAGLAGALQLPREPANPFMDLNIIVQAFVVTVIGGMGSVGGAFVAALLLGLLNAFGIVIFPKSTLVLMFLVMAVVLVIRPWGLFGRPQPVSTHGMGDERPLRPVGRWAVGASVLGLLGLAMLPLGVGDYGLRVATEILVFALFAFSLNFIMGHGGMITFGHAAYFGLGAYGAALLVHHFSLPMSAALPLAPVAAIGGALLFGWFSVRLAGVYGAMLTLAFAQIVWSVAFQWQAVTGGDNGLIGIWPDPWASGELAYYYLSLVLCVTAILGLRRVLYAPFGVVLRAGRDSPIRAEAVGIDVVTHRWLAFALAGAAAGLAGGLYAFSRGSVDPQVLGIPTSVDGLAMVLLGGIQTVIGPLLGAAALTGLEVWLLPLTDYWRLILGGIIVLLVLAFPRGLAGVALHRFDRREAAE